MAASVWTTGTFEVMFDNMVITATNQYMQGTHYRHLVGATLHGGKEKSLGNSGIIKGSNKHELTDKEHQKTVIDLRQRRLRLGNELLFFGLDFISINIVSLLGRQRIAFSIELRIVRLGVIVLMLAIVDGQKLQPAAIDTTQTSKPAAKQIKNRVTTRTCYFESRECCESCDFVVVSMCNCRCEICMVTVVELN